MTKEEAIQKAWIDVFGDKKINQIITYANKLTGFLGGFMLRNFKLDINNEKLEKKFNGVVYSYRPKSLQGIEDNNGWIRIESEEDLPKESGDYFFISKLTNRIVLSYFMDGSKVAYNKTNIVKQYSHYKLIEKPKPPVY